MITERQLAAMPGCTVDGDQGQRVGEVDYFLLDDTTGTPEWARIIDRGAGPGGVFVPLRHAELRDGHLVVPYPLELIEGSPRGEAAPGQGAVLSVAEEERLTTHYGIPDVRDVRHAQRGAGWAGMDRSQAVREGTEGHERSRSRLRILSAGSA
ncbi:hypothetical protein [Streptomyces sp. NPDC008121]|uniref:hypothetical protein n=1 Tax=Streptomyces sp. NPDC008121 TaxID=3364809 RepID=UPI0036E999F0